MTNNQAITLTLADMVRGIVRADNAARDNKGIAAAMAADAISRGGFAVMADVVDMIEATRDEESGKIRDPGSLSDAIGAADNADLLTAAAELIRVQGKRAASAFKNMVREELITAAAADGLTAVEAVKAAQVQGIELGLDKVKGGDNSAYETLSKRLQRAYTMHADAAEAAALAYTAQAAWRDTAGKAAKLAAAIAEETKAEEVRIAVRGLLGQVEAIAQSAGITPADLAGMLGGRDVAAAVAARAEADAAAAIAAANAAAEAVKTADAAAAAMAAAMGAAVTPAVTPQKAKGGKRR